jgi:hypothetical protein
MGHVSIKASGFGRLGGAVGACAIVEHGSGGDASCVPVEFASVALVERRVHFEFVFCHRSKFEAACGE